MVVFANITIVASIVGMLGFLGILEVINSYVACGLIYLLLVPGLMVFNIFMLKPMEGEEIGSAAKRAIGVSKVIIVVSVLWSVLVFTMGYILRNGI